MFPDVKLHIAGEWRAGSGGQTLPILNPATGETLSQLAVATRDDLDQALAAADRGFRAWRKVSAFERSKVLRKAANLMRERADEIAGS